jgi:hypothetical protein
MHTVLDVGQAKKHIHFGILAGTMRSWSQEKNLTLTSDSARNDLRMCLNIGIWLDYSLIIDVRKMYKRR